jgi:aminotransferase
MRDDYDARRHVMINGFREMGLDVFEPLGAFYIFPSIKSTGLSTDEFCNRILREEKVAVVPGTAFGACGEGFIRVSYAYSIESLKAALERIERFVEKVR